MVHYSNRAGLQIDTALLNFIEQDALNGLEINSEDFWNGLAQALKDFGPRNKDLLTHRQQLQTKIDDWHIAHREGTFDKADYQKYLTDIGYILPEKNDFAITTENVDPEIALISGPQLVVPIKNARYALNAANARWGSLYDAFYGTDVIDPAEHEGKMSGYNPLRGQLVIEKAKNLLNDYFPLENGKHQDVKRYTIENGQLKAVTDATTEVLQHPTQFIGYQGYAEVPQSILLQHHGLHFDIQINRDHVIGKNDPAGVADIIIESAVTTIMDCEDSVAAVDGEDKTECYANMLGLMRGDLSIKMEKNGKSFTRDLAPDRTYQTPDNGTLTLSGRSLMLIRNVGHLMTNPAVLDQDGYEIPEGLLDTFVTALIAKHDLNKPADTARNSKAGSVYIVKPKMHGPDEVAFAVDLFAAAEKVVGLPPKTLKIGIMDEERRTSVNLKECIRAASDRVIFINTGFLDRTGDEIHTSMEAGPMVPKSQMKQETWLAAYENNNVDTGLVCGFQGTAQIGKGMWAMPDMMKAMLAEKINHPQAGADCAWAPSPTAATLHALHYHMVDVDKVQDDIKDRQNQSRKEMLNIPLAKDTNWSESEIQAELDNNAQGILGYVVRWIDAGVGCSKVPDIHNVGLMEDRATLRISSQHMANWLHHDIVDEKQIMDTMKRMAKTVDEQNKSDPTYQPMALAFEKSIAFQAACDLVFKGRSQPSGYTEPLLHQKRQEYKASH